MFPVRQILRSLCILGLVGSVLVRFWLWGPLGSVALVVVSGCGVLVGPGWVVVITFTFYKIPSFRKDFVER